MIYFVNIVFSFLAAADVDCTLQPCHKKCIPPGFVCVPYGSVEIVKPYIPIVEGQRLVYFNSSEHPYNKIEEQMVPFLREWAKSCPEEKREGTSRGRENHVAVQKYSQLNSQSQEALTRSIAQVRANTIIVQLSSSLQKFAKQFWIDFLDKIPRNRGCFIIAPVTVSQYAETKSLLNSIEELIISKKHSCQILRVNEEVHGSLGRACTGPMKRSADQLDRCQMNHWVKQVQLKACDMDPRTFTADPVDSQPAPAAAGN